MRCKVYLDNCCYNRPYDDQKQLRISLETQAKMAIQKAISKGEIELVTSVMLYYENGRNTNKKVERAVSDFMARYGSEYVPENIEEVWEIQAVIESAGLKAADAFHVACAVYSHCDYFITTDDRILKYRTDSVKIVDPIMFVTERRRHRMYTDSENAMICMDILVKAVGVVDAERFVAYMNRESGDYTLSRRRVFDGMSRDELRSELSRYGSEHPRNRCQHCARDAMPTLSGGRMHPIKPSPTRNNLHAEIMRHWRGRLPEVR